MQLYESSCILIFACMFEFNGDTYHKVFEVGRIPSYMDPSKKYNEEYIAQVAKNYDPVNVHEAPLWVGHPDYTQEPRAGGWIKKVFAMGKELYVSFSEVSDWMKELYNSGEFKKCSVEMGDLEVDSTGTVIPYLWAIGATNIPAVKGLPVLKFKDEKFTAEKLHNKVSFSLLNFGYENAKQEENKNDFNKEDNFKNKNNTVMDSLKKIALSLAIELSGSETEEQLTKLIEDKTAELKASESNAMKQINDSKEASAVKLVDDAIKNGQITPAQKDEYLDFAKQNFDSCSKVLASLEKKDMTSQSAVVTGTTGRFKTEQKSDVTYEDILKDPAKFIGVLQEADILKLKEKSTFYADTKID